MNELAHLLRVASRQATRSVNTCLPGTILSYDASKQMASVKPMLRLRQPDGSDEEMPILNSVPVIWPRSGGASLTFPVKRGDGCLVMFSQRSIDEYKSSGEVSTPLDPRAHDLSDAVAIMGFVSFGGGGGPSDSVQLKFGGSTITVTDSGIEIEGGEILIKGPTTIEGPTVIEGNLALMGDFTITGDGGTGAVNVNSPGLFHNGVNVGSTHRHPGIQPGGGTTGTPT